MKKLIIENKIELMILHEILTEYKAYKKREHVKLPKLSSKFLNKTIRRLATK